MLRDPKTLAARRSTSNGRVHAETTDFPLTHLGVAWRGDSAMIRVRNPDGWTGWSSLAGCGGAPDGRGATGSNALLVLPGAVGYELVVTGLGAADVTELNTADGPSAVAATQAVPPVAPTGMPLPDGTICPVTYLRRSHWGADESLRFVNGEETWPAEYHPVQVLTVHHSAGVNNDPNPAATVRAIYFNQTVEQGWGDIGYHLLIDEAGRVYEGRVSEGDMVPAFRPNSSLLNTAGHALGYNTGNIGVVLLGDLTDQMPTSAAYNALVQVLASLARVANLNPLGTVNYFNPVNGNSGPFRAISGHRNFIPTQCPGNTFYPQMEALRAAVAAVMPPVVPRRRVFNQVGFPNVRTVPPGPALP